MNEDNKVGIIWLGFQTEGQTKGRGGPMSETKDAGKDRTSGLNARDELTQWQKT